MEENFRLLSLVINGMALALALAFLVIVLWFYYKKPLFQSFSLLVIFVTFWHSAALLSEVVPLMALNTEFSVLLALLSDIGFAGSSVALYVFVTSLIVAHTRLVRTMALVSLGLIIANNLIVLQSVLESPRQVENVSTVGISIVYFFVFDVISLYLIFRYRRKIRSTSLRVGLFLFVLGQGLIFLNPELGIVSFALLLSSIATLIMCFTMVKLELIEPLDERVSQVEAIQQISLSIMQRNRLTLVVNEATEAVVKWLDAAAAIVFLVDGDGFRVASTYRIPESMVFLGNNHGIARETLDKRKGLLYENYTRDWHGEDDFYLANETVGSLMSVPLFSDAKIEGILLVISSRRSKIFDHSDLRLLEQLSNQVAVAISHSQLFENLEEAHDQLQVVLTSTDNPVIAVDRKLHIQFINPSARLILSSELSKDISNLTSGKEPIPNSFIPHNLRGFLREIREKGFFTYEYDLDDHVYLGRIAPLGSTKIEGWVAVLNDVTDLMELDRMKSEMVRMTSHDLKNPLQAALANVDLLREDIEVENEEAIMSLNIIEKQLSKMSRIIGGILDLERIKLGRDIYSEPVEVYTLLTQVVEEIEDYATDNKIQIVEDFDELRETTMVGDFQQLKRMFVNLIENAIKFSPEFEKVLVLGEIRQKKFVVNIKDNGIGIPQELHDHIFERFFRGQQDEYQHVSGSGLGLSFVKSIVENHDGSITLASELYHGSCFSVMFDSVE